MLIGDVEIHIVSDGTMHMDAGGIYGLVPKVLWQQIEQPDELNRLPQALNCLLVRSRNKTILIDNGLGEKLTGKQERNFGRENGSQLLKNLAQLGVHLTHRLGVVPRRVRLHHRQEALGRRPEQEEAVPLVVVGHVVEEPLEPLGHALVVVRDRQAGVRERVVEELLEEEDPNDMDRFVNQEAVDFLKASVASRINIIVSGGTTHATVARSLAPLLKDGQLVLLDVPAALLRSAHPEARAFAECFYDAQSTGSSG